MCISAFYVHRKNYPKRKKWLIKSAELDNTYAMIILAHFYEEAKDYKKSEEWFLKSAYLKNTEAMINLGLLYKHKDNKKSKEWFEKGAELGSTKAMNELGFLYETQRDYTKAEELYLKSINLGSIYAYNFLGCLYHKQGSFKKAEECILKVVFFDLYYDSSITNLFFMINNNNISEVDVKIILDSLNSKGIQNKMSDKNKEIFNTLQKKYNCKLSKIYNDLNKDTCCICYDPLMGTSYGLYILVCGHVIHKECYCNNIMTLKKCPYCLRDL